MPPPPLNQPIYLENIIRYQTKLIQNKYLPRESLSNQMDSWISRRYHALESDGLHGTCRRI